MITIQDEVRNYKDLILELLNENPYLFVQFDRFCRTHIYKDFDLLFYNCKDVIKILSKMCNIKELYNMLNNIKEDYTDQKLSLPVGKIEGIPYIAYTRIKK